MQNFFHFICARAHMFRSRACAVASERARVAICSSVHLIEGCECVDSSIKSLVSYPQLYT